MTNPTIDLNKTETQADAATMTPIAAQDLSVSVGTLGNLQKVILDGARAWTAGDVLRHVGLNPSGYEIRISSRVANEHTPITSGDTIVLMAAVKGND